MITLFVRNVHQALPRAIELLKEVGVRRDSRNGPVIMAPCPVTTVYEQPCERVLLWPQRDANPFLHLYEACWMLQGRNDIKPLTKYSANIGNYSDDGITQHGAYGWRWRSAFGVDQLFEIAEILQRTPEDRRCVLQMWDARMDLAKVGKDFPCNTMATFQRDPDGRLDMSVFCRSNDIIWGAYGANAVHFSMLQEYMASLVRCQVGKYYQISVNWHAYVDKFEEIDGIQNLYGGVDPYTRKDIFSVEMGLTESRFLNLLDLVMNEADSDFVLGGNFPPDGDWIRVLWYMLRAYKEYKTLSAPNRYTEAIRILDEGLKGFQELSPGNPDWLVAGLEWMERRLEKWQER